MFAEPSPRARTAIALTLALVAALLVYRTWGGLDRPGLYHDEKAYVLQSRIYAELKWTEDTPPVPALWEQVHVFMEPRYASRYPPGFPAALAIGAAMGKPGLIPVLCAAATAALVFLFGSRLFGTWTALLATSLWLAAPMNTTWRAAYFSESLTGLLWIAWCWCAWRYRRDGNPRDLIATALLVAIAAITRPATTVALAIPLAVILWPRLRDRAHWRHFAVASGAALLVCAMVPIWNHAVLGSYTTLPYAEYSPRTFPFDMPTWKTNWAPPPRELPPDIAALADSQKIPFQQRTLAGLPGAFVARASAMGSAALPSALSWLKYVALAGLLISGGAGTVALASVLLLLLAHLTMPHPANWTIYYLDVFPVVAFGAVIALRRGAELALARRADADRFLGNAPVIAVLAGVTLLSAAATRWRPPSVDEHGWMKRELFFRAGLCALPAGDKVVFVRPRPKSSPHHMLIDNDPRWRSSDTWIVREWDVARNRALLDAAPNRAAYLYDENAGWFARMNRDGSATREGVVNVLRADLSQGRGLVCRTAG